MNPKNIWIFIDFLIDSLWFYTNTRSSPNTTGVNVINFYSKTV